MNSILQIRFREIMRLAQYHAIGGGGCVVLRSFKKTCCKKAGWWTFSRCLILKSSAASIPETIIQYSCLEISMDRGAWQATIHRVSKTLTRLNMHACTTLVVRLLRRYWTTNFIKVSHLEFHYMALSTNTILSIRKVSVN